MLKERLGRVLQHRAFPRIHAEHSALIKRLHQDGAPFEALARTKVLGLGGCLLLADESLGSGSLLEVLIAFDGRVVRTDARVVYEIPRSDSRLEVGVQFLRLDPTDRALIASRVRRQAGPC